MTISMTLSMTFPSNYRPNNWIDVSFRALDFN